MVDRICRQFARNGTCKYGENCKFQHAANGKKHSRVEHKSTPPSSTLSNSEREFRSWKFSIPLSSKEVLPAGKLANIFQKALHLIDIDAGVRQSVTQKLADEEGLACIKMVIEQNVEQLSANLKQKLFETQFLPILRIVSHPDVLQSLILEQPVGTIYNFMFGIGGQRASKLLNFCSEVLASSASRESTALWLETCILVFSKIVDLNSTALVQESLKDLADRFQTIFIAWIKDHPENSLS